MKIVSLIPAATEIVSLLGFQDSLIGISHECDFPPEISKCEKLTFSRIPTEISSAEIDQLTTQKAFDNDGLFGLHSDRIVELCPDIIITQSICDVCAVSRGALGNVMDRLPKSTRLITLSPTSLMDVLESIVSVSRELQSPSRGQFVFHELLDRLEQLKSRSLNSTPKTAVLLEWLDPIFSAGHWNPELIALGGAGN